MNKVGSKDTTPETIFRKTLWSRGFRYRVCPDNILGKPDVVFVAKKIAIFIDGDFWHGRQWKQRKLSSLEDQFQKTSTKDYWLNKIRRNMERDCRVTSELISKGWTVLRFWESDIRKNLEGCVQMAIEVLKNHSQQEPSTQAVNKSFAEFFAGIGLMRMGLEQQGWFIALANDIDAQKKKMYEGHFTDVNNHFILDDIHNLKGEDIPFVTLATASFPCNDLSLAGARKGLNGRHSSAFWGFARLIKEMGVRKPPLILLENVTGLLTSHGGADYREVLLTLNSLGYSVDAFIIDASHFVPQSRQRLFVVGVLDGLNVLGVKEQLHFYESDLRPKALGDFILEHPEIRWNIRDLPSLPNVKSSLQDILEDLPDDSPRWWNKERSEYLLNQMSEKHREIAERMIRGKDHSFGTVFRRVRKGKSMAELRTDGIAGCLRTPRGGSGRQILFKAGKGGYQVRLLTPKECARLMGANEFKITVPPNQALFGFGDAVCVPVIEWIAKYYLNPIVNEIIRNKPLQLCK
ncbi:MAG TPA: DNA (cytosine-5-)-methyltransferase [Firmicutes bacterium]|jgi:DNA (cytosine-5)-methyltransferase 1|nr:DNA (cytosine-5-)-methyltransferase [Bacillota bacterium]